MCNMIELFSPAAVVFMWIAGDIFWSIEISVKSNYFVLLF